MPASPIPRSPWREALYPLLVVALTGLAYGHLVGNDFWLDDYYYLYLMEDRRPLEYALTVHGGHVQTLRNLVLWLFHFLFGLRVEWFFAVVLATHLVNALLLFSLLRRLTASDGLACLGALLWSTNGLAEGSLGWLSVYGHVMVGTLLLWVLWRVQLAADRSPSPVPGEGRDGGTSNASLADPHPNLPPGRGKVSLQRGQVSRTDAALWYLALLAGSLSFGTGVGVALVFPAVLALWLPGPRHRRLRIAFATLPVVTLALYLLSHALYFLVTERVDSTVASSPQLLQVLGFVPVMIASLMATSLGALVAGPYFAPGQMMQVGALLLLAGLAAVVVVNGPPLLRRRLAAALLLSIGAYATITAGRVAVLVLTLRSVVEAAAWPRYHYVGTIGLAIALTLGIARVRPWLPRSRVVAAALLGAWIVWTAIGVARYPYRTPYTLDPYLEFTKLNFRIVKHIRESPDPARAYIINQQYRPIGPWVTHEDFPGQAAAFVIYHPSDRILDKDIYFVETDPQTVAAARRRPWSRTAGLLITPEEYDRLSGIRRTDDPEERFKRMCIDRAFIQERGPQCVAYDSEEVS